MAKCPKVACPVIKQHCTTTQSDKGKCYITVGSKKYVTKTHDGTFAKTGKLAAAQARRRCQPLVKGSSGGGRPKTQRAVLRKEIRDRLRALSKATKAEQKELHARYKKLKTAKLDGWGKRRRRSRR